jgi:Flp pilus assembly protein TadG
MTMLQLMERARMILGLSNATDKVAMLKADRRGVALIEFAFFAGLLSFAILNVTDVSIYIYQRMEVENATQMAAQAAWKNCDLTHLPATANCPALTHAVQNAVQSTSLGTRVSLQPGSPSEGYYCVNSSNALEYVSAVTSMPDNCSAAGMPGLKPGDYIKIATTFTYTPLFPGITVANAFATPIIRTAFMRLG